MVGCAGAVGNVGAVAVVTESLVAADGAAAMLGTAISGMGAGVGFGMVSFGGAIGFIGAGCGAGREVSGGISVANTASGSLTTCCVMPFFSA